MSHPMLPRTTHDELAEQCFVRDLKKYLRLELDPVRRARCEAVESAMPPDADAADILTLRDTLLEDATFRRITILQRESQELLWRMVGDCVDRQLPELEALAASGESSGSLTLDPALAVPAYIAARDTHLMPGGFGVDGGPGSVRQGAIMDRGGAVYMMGRNGQNGGLMNDGRAHSIIDQLYQFFPDLAPRDILELGCGIGNTIGGMAPYFPEARLVACDLGADMLRYAHGRAVHSGVPVHFRQAAAEATGLPDGSFDLVYTSAVFHEVEGPAIARIVAEAHRLLRPGGAMINLDVSGRYEELTTWQRVSGSMDLDFNNEIGWLTSVTADYRALLEQAGFQEVQVGYQPSSGRAERGRAGFASHGYRGVGAGWYMSSGRKSFAPAA